MRAANDSQRRVPRWAAATTAGLIVLFVASHLVPEAAHPVAWLTPAEAEQSPSDGRPVLYDFTAAWCRPCRRLDRDVFRNPEVAAAINQRFTPVKVVDRLREDGQNPPEVQTLKERYQVQAFPTLVIADANGALLNRLEGYPGALATRKFLLDSVNPPPPAGETPTPRSTPIPAQ